MLTLFHGTRRTEFPRHAGLCLAESREIAWDYAVGASDPDALDEGALRIYRIVLDDDLLSWDRLPPWDRDNQIAPADRDPAALAADLGVCSVWYADESPRQRAHDTLRLLTPDALDAIVSVEVVS